jgi:breast cancer 2 susceptibility protein
MKISASNALFYHFATPGTAMKGPEDAYQQILKDGCSQITQIWVNNHWSLILWKLAGIVRAKPALWEARWNFDEVVRQLKYRYVTLDFDEPRSHVLSVPSHRYEREVNLAQRPAIKRLQEQDSPASLPMVLCVTSIIRGEPKTGEGSSAASSSLELTDGWYRIRANVDPPLQRAIDSGKLTIGYKMAIAGARVSCLQSA